jgi:two-component system nitrogen regulation response regulator NtrX
MKQDILIIDDEADIRSLISGILQDEGYETREAADGLKGIDLIRDRMPGLVILDIWLGDSRNDGIRILELIKQETPDLPVLMISGHGTIETAVAAIKRGAYDFIEKPFKAERLLILVRRALETASLRYEVNELKQRSTESLDIIGQSSFTNTLRQTIQKIAPTNSRVLITGPSGSGKELVARLIHQGFRGERGRMVVVNCAVDDSATLEKELYGEEKNGERTRIGAFEQAHNGTLLLDEIANIPMVCQSKLVRVLHEQSFTRVGGTRKVQANVRVIASSSLDCQNAINQQQLREDLYYRLSVISVGIQPLAQRVEDIPYLAEHFLKVIAESRGALPPKLTNEALSALQVYPWPGNIRQLKNVAEWIVIMTEKEVSQEVTLNMLPVDVTSKSPAVMTIDKSNDILNLPLREAREAFEREYMLAQLAKFSGNVSQTAMFIGMERSALHRKLRLLSVHAPCSLLKESGT